jgi:hypothetical protein
VGAANFLGHTNDAKLAADGTRDTLSRRGILPGYGQDGDADGFDGIGARWIAKFMKDRGLQTSYRQWLQANAGAAWQCPPAQRRPRLVALVAAHAGRAVAFVGVQQLGGHSARHAANAIN